MANSEATHLTIIGGISIILLYILLYILLLPLSKTSEPDLERQQYTARPATVDTRPVKHLHYGATQQYLYPERQQRASAQREQVVAVQSTTVNDTCSDTPPSVKHVIGLQGVAEEVTARQSRAQVRAEESARVILHRQREVQHDYGDSQLPTATTEAERVLPSEVGKKAHHTRIHLAQPKDEVRVRVDIDDPGTAGPSSAVEDVKGKKQDIDPGSEWREKAAAQARLRDEAYENAKAANAQQRRSEAKMFSTRGRLYEETMKQYNDRAAEEIFAHFNPRHSSATPSDLRRCDLHGLYVSEATRYVKDHMGSCREAGVRETVIITGKGKRSKDGTPKIKPAIVKLLGSDENLTFQLGVPDGGCITVQIGNIVGTTNV